MGHKSDQAALRYMHATSDADAVMARGLDAAIRQAQASAADAADVG